jgi:hypothetical protein
LPILPVQITNPIKKSGVIYNASNTIKTKAVIHTANSIFIALTYFNNKDDK